MFCVFTATLHFNEKNYPQTKTPRKILGLYMLRFHIIIFSKCVCNCLQIGSLDGLYTLRDSRGRPDRATFENELAATAGVSVFNCHNKSPLLSKTPIMCGDPRIIKLHPQ